MRYTVPSGSLNAIRLSESDPVASVLQNIAIILSTRQGSVPLYREFGLPMRFLDKPTPVAKPLMVAEIKAAIDEFEPRAEFIRVTFQEDASTPGKLIPAVEVEIHE